jgi:isopentenyl diphosphate isomerase/L-lactate dehydrogenase-like FMN-dependent dehydrogenase
LVDAKANVNLVGKDKFNILERYFTYADNIDPEIVDLILKAGFDTKLLKLDDQILLEKIKDSKNHAVNTERQEMTKSLTRKGQNTSSLAPIKK